VPLARHGAGDVHREDASSAVAIVVALVVDDKRSRAGVVVVDEGVATVSSVEGGDLLEVVVVAALDVDVVDARGIRAVVAEDKMHGGVRAAGGLNGDNVSAREASAVGSLNGALVARRQGGEDDARLVGRDGAHAADEWRGSRGRCGRGRGRG
jgi:hypothetical protein